MKSKPLRGSITALAAVLLCASPAGADVGWPADSIVECFPFGLLGARSVRFVADPAGLEWAFGQHQASSGYYWSFRSLLPEGAPGVTGGQISGGAAAVPDGTGGLLVLSGQSETDWSLGGYSPAGTALPSTPITTNRIDASPASGCAADGGGAWFLWQGSGDQTGVWLVRAAAGGGVAAGWPAAGIRLATAGASMNAPMAMAADGSGGVLALLASDGMRAYRVEGDTTLAPGWPADGLPLDAPGLAYYLESNTWLVRSDATHFLAVWAGYLPEGYVFKCQRFSLDGAVDPAWPSDGRVVRDPFAMGTGSAAFDVVPDGSGGVFVGWIEGDAVQLSHVLVSGDPATGFESGPQAVVPLSGTPTPTTFGLVPAPGGCCIVHSASDGSIRARWTRFDGEPALPSPLDDQVLFTLSQLVDRGASWYGGARALRAGADGEGGFYFGWNGETGFYLNSLFVSHAVWPGAALAVPPSAPATLALAAGPNPARGALAVRFSLPDARPARLELLDLAGRRMRSFAVAGAGTHTERLEALGALAPGVYLLRLSQGGEARVTRVALIR